MHETVNWRGDSVARAMVHVDANTWDYATARQPQKKKKQTNLTGVNTKTSRTKKKEMESAHAKRKICINKLSLNYTVLILTSAWISGVLYAQSYIKSRSIGCSVVDMVSVCLCVLFFFFFFFHLLTAKIMFLH